MTGLFVRSLTDAIISWCRNAHGLPRRRSPLYLLAPSLAVSVGSFLLSPARRVRRTKPFAISIKLIAAMLCSEAWP
jgi:hypothetical protein